MLYKLMPDPKFMKKVKIAFFDSKPYDIKAFDAGNKSFNYDIKYYNNRLTSDTASLVKGANAICIFVNDVIDKSIVNILIKHHIKIIALRCAGYNNVALNAVYKKIHVVRVPAYSPYAVAEHAVTLILSLNRKIHKAYYRTRDNNFNINGLLGFDMFNKTAGIIGTGKIGKILINILKGFGMKILAYDSFHDKKYASKIGFDYVDLNTLYKKSDIISLHCPLTKETKHMINKSSLKKMKKNVLIINTGRGKLIDTKSLIDALKKHMIGGAGLDVYEEESEYFFEDFSSEIINDDVLARLLTFPNVLVTSHQGFFTKEALQNISQTTLENIKDFFNNKTLKNEICYRCNAKICFKKSKGYCF